jgi:MFS family permease
MPRDLLLVAFSLFIWGIGEGMFAYFQPIYLQQWGADPLQIGAIFGALGISMAVAQAPAGYLSDRVGSRPVMWASWLLGTTAAFIMAMAGALPVFIVGLLVYGLTSFVIAPLNSYLTSVRGTWSVERALTIPSALFNAGMIIGPILGGMIAETFGIRRIYSIAAVLFVVSSTVVLFARKPPIEEHHAGVKPRSTDLLHSSRFMGLLGILFVTMFVLYIPQPLTPNFLQNEAGLSLRTIGQLGSFGSLGNTLIVLVFGGLRAPLGFLIGQVLMGVFALLLWQGSSLPWYAVGYFFIGGYRLSRMMVLAYARSFVPVSQVGFAFGLIETVNAATIILAPLLAGWLYRSEPRSMYQVALVSILVVIFLNLLVSRLISRKSPETNLNA